MRNTEPLGVADELWASLAAGHARSPVQCPAWTRAFVDGPDAGAPLRILSIGDSERLRAIAPLWWHPESRRLEMIGARELSEPSDVLFENEEALGELADAVAAERLPVFLYRLYADSAFLPALRRAVGRRGLVLSRPALGAPTIPLDPSWADPESRFDAGRRSDLRRAERRARSFGDPSFQILAPSPTELGPALDEAIRVENRSWKGAAGTSLARDPLRGGFYRRYAEAAAREGTLRIAFLRLGERTAAMQIAVRFARRFWLLKVGYDEEFARASPGTLLTLSTIREAALQGLEAYEFLGVPDDWTRRWAQREHPCVNVRAYPATRRGAGAVARDTSLRMRQVLRRVKEAG